MSDDNKIETIKVPPSTFVFGERKHDVLGARVLYGPPNEKNERQVVALVQPEAVGRLQSMLEYADEGMRMDGLDG